MQTWTDHILFAVIVIAAFMSFPELVYAQNYEQEYVVHNESGTYRLTLSVTHELYDYYLQMSHHLVQGSFDEFVTPYSLQLVASDLLSISLDEENFVNLALMIVHQIPYEAVGEARYPVETIVNNLGDCDCFSFIVASLLKSEDFDVVLLYYEELSHMNIGVSLPLAPQDARTTVSYVEYGGTRYYMAECTGGDWRNGWRVGECPPDLEGAQVSVVTLDDYELVAPGQVYSNFGSVEDSLISLYVSSSFLMEGSVLFANGQVFASDPVGNVTLYAGGRDGWASIGTVCSDSNGLYSFSWNPSSWGQYSLKASWSGNEEFAGADSQVISVFIAPKALVFGVVAILVVGIVTVVLLLMYRTSQPQEADVYEIPEEYFESSDFSSE
jgi:hypothetical protein